MIVQLRQLTVCSTNISSALVTWWWRWSCRGRWRRSSCWRDSARPSVSAATWSTASCWPGPGTGCGPRYASSSGCILGEGHIIDFTHIDSYYFCLATSSFKIIGKRHHASSSFESLPFNFNISWISFHKLDSFGRLISLHPDDNLYIISILHIN